jgi:hypothetical protein
MGSFVHKIPSFHAEIDESAAPPLGKSHPDLRYEEVVKNEMKDKPAYVIYNIRNLNFHSQLVYRVESTAKDSSFSDLPSCNIHTRD